MEFDFIEVSEIREAIIQQVDRLETLLNAPYSKKEHEEEHITMKIAILKDIFEKLNKK